MMPEPTMLFTSTATALVRFMNFRILPPGGIVQLRLSDRTETNPTTDHDRDVETKKRALVMNQRPFSTL
jgi:hypothetical protein